MLLAGDIGGTKTVLALYQELSQADFDHQPVREAVYPSNNYPSLEAIIAEFLSTGGHDITGASFGVAGPVVNRRAQITNLSWTIDAEVISDALGAEAHLLNDLEAIANAVPYLEAEDVFVLNEGRPEPGGAIAVIAPGTGLGEAFLVWQAAENRYESYPSEGGHAAFAPTTPRQLALLEYWQSRMEHVSYERLCSGIGIPNIYYYLANGGKFEEPDWLRDELEAVADMTPVIVTAAVERKAEICVETLDLFMEILGGESANLALKVLATGGVFIGGGIAPRILPQLKDGNFLDRFCSKGRFSTMMCNMPVKVIRNPKVALYGAAYEALKIAR